MSDFPFILQHVDLQKADLISKIKVQLNFYWQQRLKFLWNWIIA